MGKNDPERKAGWVCDPKALSDHDQLPAVDQSDRWSERPTIKQKRSDKNDAGAEQLGRKGNNLPARNHLVRNRRQESKTENRVARPNFSLAHLSGPGGEAEEIDRLMSRSPLEPFFPQSQGRYQSFKNVFILPGRRATFGGGPTENDEIRMAKLEGMTNGQMTKDREAVFWAFRPGLARRRSPERPKTGAAFDIRHWGFVISWRVILMVVAQTGIAALAHAQSPNMIGSWKVDITFMNGESRSLRFDAQGTGKGSFLLLDPRLKVWGPGKPSEAKWTQGEGNSVTFSGPVEFLIGNVGRDAGTLVVQGKICNRWLDQWRGRILLPRWRSTLEARHVQSDPCPERINP